MSDIISQHTNTMKYILLFSGVITLGTASFLNNILLAGLGWALLILMLAILINDVVLQWYLIKTQERKQ